MSSLKVSQDDGNDDKYGLPNELSEEATLTQPAEDANTSNNQNKRRKRSACCDICRTLLPPSQEGETYCHDCETRMNGRHVTECEYCTSPCIQRPVDWVRSPDQRCDRDCEAFLRAQTRESEPQGQQQQQQFVHVLRCQLCRCVKSKSEFSPRQWKLNDNNNNNNNNLRSKCLACLPLDQEWKQIIQDEWKKDGPVIQRLFRQDHASTYHLPSASRLPMMENPQAIQQLRDDLSGAGRRRIKYDVVFERAQETLEELECSFFRQRTPGKDSPTTMELWLSDENRNGSDGSDDDSWFDLEDRHFICGNMKQTGHYKNNDDEALTMDFDFAFTSALEEGEMTQLANADALQHRDLTDCRDLSFQILKEPTSLPWIPADNIHPDCRYAQHLRAQLEQFHGHKTTKQNKQEVLWLTRHKDLPQLVSQRIYEFATSQRPSPQFQLQKGDVILKAEFCHYADEGLYTWIARRRSS